MAAYIKITFLYTVLIYSSVAFNVRSSTSPSSPIHPLFMPIFPLLRPFIDHSRVCTDLNLMSYRNIFISNQQANDKQISKCVH